MSKTAKLQLEGKTIDLPIIEGSEKEKGIDISKLRSDTGYITLDNGLGNTGSCQSSVTFLNGEEGILRYRGYSIEELAEKSSFLEVSYLLINGELPNSEKLKKFEKNIQENLKIPNEVNQLIRSFPADAHPMGVLSSATVGLSGFNKEILKPNLSAEKIELVIAQLMAQLKVIATNFYRRTKGHDPYETHENFDYSLDFLYRMFHTGEKIDEKLAKALDTLFILHADHEQNCSASTVRIVGSGQGNVYGAIASGINALWGPLHGGANQAVIEMLDQIKKDGGDYKKFLVKAKDKNDPFRLMGFGHRVYKNFDPRAKIIKEACDSVLESLGIDDPVLEIAKGLEEEALNDEYFVKRKLYPNVDFYSGIIYRALGIPTNMFTVMFALGRLPGWLSQWKELVTSNTMRITRPRQIYVGKNLREYTPIENR